MEESTPGLNPVGLILPPEPDSYTGPWGTEIHAVKAGGPDPLGWGGPHVDHLWPPHLGEHEVSFAYDCATRTVEVFRHPDEDERTKWKLSRGPNTVVGTADWWGRLPSGVPWVDDLKTGWRRPERRTAQLAMYLLARFALPDAAQWDHGWTSATWWPRAKEPTVPDRDGLWLRYSRVELELFADEVDAAWRRAVGPDPQPRPGAHCLYCPSATVCTRANDY